MVLCADPSDREIVVQRLKQVLKDATDESIHTCQSATEAAGNYGDAPWEFLLLVVDIHAPLGRAVDATDSTARASVGDGGYLFIDKYVLQCGYPPPPILLTSRFGDFKPQAAQLIDELDMAHFTAAALYQKCDKLGVSTRQTSSLFENLTCDRALDEQQAEKYVRSILNSYFIDLYLERRPDKKGELALYIVRKIDDSVAVEANRSEVFANEEVVRSISTWYQRLQPVIESDESGVKDHRSLAWFHMLRADLLWCLRPVESLYSLMTVISLDLEANGEPMGMPGDRAYKIALRRNNENQSWFRRALARLRRSQPGTYAENVWRDLLRSQVTKATRSLKAYPKALLDIEIKLRELSARLEERGHARAAHELDARSCEVRKGRLSWSERLLYGLLGVLCDYGNRPLLLFGWCIFFVILFAGLYLPTPAGWPVAPGPFVVHFKDWPYTATQGLRGVAWLKAGVENMVTAFYFSVVTFVTLGYGDITPANTWGKVLTAFEAALGFIMFGLSIAVASTRLRPR